MNEDNLDIVHNANAGGIAAPNNKPYPNTLRRPSPNSLRKPSPTIIRSEDSLNVVQNVNAGGIAAPRNITPNKSLFPNSLRRPSPTLLSRSNSTPKSRALSKIIYESQNIRPQSNTRSLSRRKERRYENDNLFGVSKYIKGREGFSKEDEIKLQEEILKNLQNFSIKVDWRSSLSELFQPLNLNKMESFRSCHSNTNGLDVIESSSKRAIRTDKWEEAEIAWLKLEKRLRASVAASLEDNLTLCLFVKALESVIIYYIEFSKAPPISLIPPVLSEMLVSPIECVVSKKNKELNNIDGITSLAISLKDSAFHRLFVHATCQFYGLKTKSVSIKNKRITHISLPTQSVPTSNLKLSMVGYLVAKSNRNDMTVSNQDYENDDHSIDNELNRLEKLNLNLEHNSDGNNSDGFIVLEELDNFIFVENQ